MLRRLVALHLIVFQELFFPGLALRGFLHPEGRALGFVLPEDIGVHEDLAALAAPCTYIENNLYYIRYVRSNFLNVTTLR